jgi:hypothetical protein
VECGTCSSITCSSHPAAGNARLVDVEARFFDLVAAGPDVQGALALHPGQFGDGQDALVLVGHLYQYLSFRVCR